MRRLAWIGVLAALVVGIAGCSDDSDSDSGKETQPLTCGGKVEERELQPTSHVTGCSAITYTTNPPSSGDHYGVWAAFGVYEAELPRGFWVHDLEHGAVVVTYNCPDGCDSDIEKARAWVESAEAEESCTSGPRLMLVPDSLLDIEWAASAWGVTLRANCFDKSMFDAFYELHRGHAPEDICVPGEDFRKPDGTLTLDANCGK